MDLYQLRTFVAVAGERSITKAAERLFLSQPAVSAHIKAMEDELDLVLFERTPRGMALTGDGERLLGKAEQLLGMHREFLQEARRIKGKVSGKLALGAVRSADHAILGRLLARLAESYPEIEVGLQSRSSEDILRDLRSGSLDAGFLVHAGPVDEDIESVEISRFGIYLAAPPSMVGRDTALDWQRLATLPWICPMSSTCCGRVAESLFAAHGFRPARLVNVDQEGVTRTLIAGGVGIGLLHQDNALDAQREGKAVLLGDPVEEVALQFAYLAHRSTETVIAAVAAIVRELQA